MQRFLRDFPQTTTIGVWNEANHRSQPVSKNPKLAAKYFLAARDACRGCKIVAIDLLDQTNMVSYLQGFDRFDKGKASIYGLHNYGDVNRNRALYTRQLLSRVGGEVWATETGGIMTFKPNFPRHPKRQANRTKYMFKLGAKYDSRQPGMRSSITRIYNYQWTGAPKGSRFDAGLVDPDFSPRPAFKVFKKKARAQGR